MSIIKENLVNLENHNYKVILSESFKGINDYLINIQNVSSFQIITEKILYDLYSAELSRELSSLNIPFHFIIIKGKESNKHISKVGNVYNQLIRNTADRKSVILALGGGVVGDFSGFIASTFLRGVRFVQIPTTLLACVDSSVGGKVAVNADLGKNMIGSFHQPELVFAPLNTLINSLPLKEWKCGISEVIKHSLLDGDEFFGKMETISKKDFKSVDNISFYITDSVRYKSKIVGMDPKENGIRAVLNLGHTTGHAIESFLNYKKISHGEAVGIGIITALLISQSKLGLSDKVIKSTIKIMKKLGVPYKTNLNPSILIDHMKHDKKNSKGKIYFVLLSSIGEPKFGIEINESEISNAIHSQSKL
jgi:3-dehydroquinate synthase